MNWQSSKTVNLILIFILTAGSAQAGLVSKLPRTDRTPEVVISSSAANRLEGYALTAEGRMVAFETRRGDPTPQELREVDPSTPPYEIDVRFLDETGFPFLTIYGGHGSIDSTWDVTDAFPTDRSDDLTLSTYATARAMIRSIENSTFAAETSSDMGGDRSWTPERDILLNVAGPALDDLSVIRIIETGTPKVETPSRTRMKVGTNATSTDIYKWQIEVHKKVASFSFGLGDHSATLSRSISSKGVTQQTIITSNHGAAANLMNVSCTWTSAATMPKSLPAIGSATDGSYYYCNRTPYGFTSGKHVCNDDSYVQAQTIRYKAGPASWVTCGDSTLRRYAPACQ
jgi:hypothetical protein